MEKIYEEKQQQSKQQKKQNKKKIKLDGVTMLSFAVALFAIVSLVAAGISGFSYAVPTPVNYGESFTGHSGVELYDDSDGMQTVEYHYATISGSNIPLFCLERNINFGTDETYTNSENATVSNDMGLYYILSKIAVEGATWDTSGITITNNDSSNTLTMDHVKYWAGQAAIWYYLHDSRSANNSISTTPELKNATIVATKDSSSGSGGTSNFTNLSSASYFTASTSGAKLFDTIKVGGMTISTLVANAKDASKNNVSFAISLSDGEGTITTDDKKKYYFSPKYTVVPVVSDPNLGSFVNYKIKITAKNEEGKTVDVGAVVAKESGEVVSNTDALTIADLEKFYVRVPAEKITESVNVGVSITGNFQAYEGLKYTTAGNDQTVAALRFVNKSKNTGKTFNLAPSDDTGISAGQTIYFVGLIVLLCGVGIIYANARPAKAQN